jgi:hypothetical protein
VEREWHAQDELVVQRCEEGEEGVGCVLCKWHILPFKFNDAGGRARGRVLVRDEHVAGMCVEVAHVTWWSDD